MGRIAIFETYAGKRTPIELFLAGLSDWDSEIKRPLVDSKLWPIASI
jgi:hypothetical protein